MIRTWSTPVKSLISPRLAFSYSPLVSLLMHSSSGVLTKTSKKSRPRFACTFLGIFLDGGLNIKMSLLLLSYNFIANFMNFFFGKMEDSLLDHAALISKT